MYGGYPSFDIDESLIDEVEQRTQIIRFENKVWNDYSEYQGIDVKDQKTGITIFLFSLATSCVQNVYELKQENSSELNKTYNW